MLLVLAAVLVLGGGAVAAGVYFLGKDPASAQVGDCIRYTDVGEAQAGTDVTEVTAEKVDCGDRSATYEVAVRFDTRSGTCPSDIYDEYTQEGGDAFKLCLIPNAEEGACYEFSDEVDGQIDCSEAPSPDRIRVIRVFEGTNDPAQCATVSEPTSPLAYPTPPRTICLAPL